MTSPREHVLELTGLAAALADDADILDACGMHHAALAATDQGMAAEAHAAKIARESGDADLIAWGEAP